MSFKFKPFVNIKNIYKTFIDEVGFTIKMSGTITVALLIIYLIFALILNQIGSLELLGLFEYILVLLGICLVLGLLSPFIYSFFAINGGLHTKARDKIKYTSFLKTYLIGTRPPFSGQLKVSMTLIKAICIDILLTLVITLIVYLFSLIPGNELNAFFNELAKAMNSSTDPNAALDAMNDVLLAHESFIDNLSLLVSFFPLFFATYYFIHTIAKNTFKYYLATSLGPRVPQQVVDFIFVKGIREHRKDYNLNYYSTCFPITILYVLAFTLSYFLLGYLGPAQMSQSILSLTSIVISVIICLPFFPIVFNMHENLWGKYSMIFMAVFLENAKKELDAYKQNSQMAARMGEENLKRAEGSLDQMKNNIIEQLKQQGYEDSDFEGLSLDDIYNNMGENDSYIPYKRKMERLQKETQNKTETALNKNEENKENENHENTLNSSNTQDASSQVIDVSASEHSNETKETNTETKESTNEDNKTQNEEKKNE